MSATMIRQTVISNVVLVRSPVSRRVAPVIVMTVNLGRALVVAVVRTVEVVRVEEVVRVLK